MSIDDADARRAAHEQIRSRVKLVLKECESEGTSPEERIRTEFSGAELQTALSMLKKRTSSSPDILHSHSKQIVSSTLASEHGPHPVTPDLGPDYYVDNTGPLGRGGKGTVWRAKNLRLIRDVAVKFLVRSGTREQLEAEAQKLAKIDHPNVVMVHGVGFALTPKQAPYLEMKYVDDPLSITNFCDLKRLSVRQRLQLFKGACKGVHATHQKRVLHLDLKPDNILLSQTSPDPIAQVIDYGLAKLTTDETSIKQADSRARPSGTYAYLAPEQIEGEVGFQTDVYALGLILFELLTGRAHHSILIEGETSFAVTDQKILNAEPVTPSEFVQRAIDKAAIAEKRSARPEQMFREISGELDCIVRRALQNNPIERYASAEDLAKDIQRHLDDDVVLAHPKTKKYYWPKVYRKHSLQIWSAFFVLLAMTIGLSASTIGFFVAQKARAEAELSEDQMFEALRQGTDDAVVYLIGSKTTVGLREEKYLQEVLKRWQAFADRNGVDARSEAIRGESHYRVGRVYTQLARSGDAINAYAKSVRIFEDLLQRFPEKSSHKHNLAAALRHLSMALSDQGDDVAALPHAERSHQYFSQLQEQYPEKTQPQEELVSCCNLLGLLHSASEDKRSLGFFDQGERILESLLLDSPFNPSYLRLHANQHNSRGLWQYHQGEMTLAATSYKLAIESCEKLTSAVLATPEDSELHAMCLGNLATALHRNGDFDGCNLAYQDALAIRRRLADEFPSIPMLHYQLASSYTNYGAFLAEIGRTEKAKEAHEEAVGLLQPLCKKHPLNAECQYGLAFAQVNYADFLDQSGATDDALRAYAESHVSLKAIAESRRDEVRVMTLLGRLHTNRGTCYLQRGELDSAEDELLRGIGILTPLSKSTEGPKVLADLASTHDNLGVVYARQRDHNKAHEQFKKAVDLLDELVIRLPETPEFKGKCASVIGNYALSLQELGKTKESVEQLRRAETLLEELLKQLPDAMHYRVSLGGNLGNQAHAERQSGHYAESLPLYDKAIATLSSGFPDGLVNVQLSRFLRNNYFGRATSYSQLNRFEEAVKDWNRVVEMSPPEEQPFHRLSRCEAVLRSGNVTSAVSELDELFSLTESRVVMPRLWEANQQYQIAYLHSLASDAVPERQVELAARAVTLLRKAARAGYCTEQAVAHILSDRDMDPIESRDDFKALMKQVIDANGDPMKIPE